MIRRLERRLERLEAATHMDGERPPELTKEEKDILDEHFDVDPGGQNDRTQRPEPPILAVTGTFYWY